MNAPQQSGMEHVRQADIANIHSAARKEAARFIRFDAAPDESS
jgi:hypothetical protein